MNPLALPEVVGWSRSHEPHTGATIYSLGSWIVAVGDVDAEPGTLVADVGLDDGTHLWSTSLDADSDRDLRVLLASIAIR